MAGHPWLFVGRRMWFHLLFDDLAMAFCQARPRRLSVVGGLSPGQTTQSGQAVN
jgi:hypothetical protein